MFKKLLIWLDKRFVISSHAQRCATLAQMNSQSFDELYDKNLTEKTRGRYEK
tara:strand:+ start:142 stop:297 length:156 start_codon:yes stop_codon:yes gene_type:complete